MRQPKADQETVCVDEKDLPYEIVKIHDIWITAKDGVKLQGHLWIPKKAWEDESGSIKLGTIVEYIPYRTDVTIVRDSIRHPYFAGNGFASLRIDMRGCSSSDGILYDEYLEQEQQDALDAFDWITKQKWSNGNIGIFGKSWGGFNSLQIAAKQHPALKAAIPLMFTDDRYSDDVHYRGGCMLASDMLWWGTTMLCYGPRPQDPSIVGSEWKKNWLQRLNIKPMLFNWIEHQTRDSFWKHGSVCEDYSKVDIPVLAFGGWRDGYTTPVFRLAKNLGDHISSVIGPWVHEFPEVASPGPKVGFQQLALNWFQKYLYPEKKEFQEFQMPRLTAYLQEPSNISDSYSSRDGRWVSKNEKTAKKYRKFTLTDKQSLCEKPEEGSANEIGVSFKGTLSHGMHRGNWCPFGMEGDFPSDQRYEDGKCCCFDSGIIQQRMELLGEPVLQASVSSDKKLAHLCASLIDIYPDGGEHILISWGNLNLTHRKSHEYPEYLTPGEVYDVKVPLDVVGTVIEKGHKLRLALSTVSWPSAWPTPEIPTLTLHKATLLLPELDASTVVKTPDLRTPSVVKRTVEVKPILPENRVKTVTYDAAKDEWVLVDVQDGGENQIDHYDELSGTYYGEYNKNTWRINPLDPLTAYNECIYNCHLGRKRDNWDIKMETKAVMTCDSENFYVTAEIKAWDQKLEVFSKEWKETIKRQFT